MPRLHVTVIVVALVTAPALHAHAPVQQTPPAANRPAPTTPAPTTPAPTTPAPTSQAPTAQPAPTSPAPATPPAAGAAAAQAAPAPPPAEPYTYNPDGRRDPFINLLGTGGDLRAVTRGRSDGPGTLAVSDISVRGILQSQGALIAMIQGPDNKTYIVHQGDRLLDGTIKSINPQGLVVVQEVNDPLSLVKQREVSKLLRTLEALKP